MFNEYQTESSAKEQIGRVTSDDLAAKASRVNRQAAYMAEQGKQREQQQHIVPFVGLYDLVRNQSTAIQSLEREVERLEIAMRGSTSSPATQSLNEDAPPETVLQVAMKSVAATNTLTDRIYRISSQFLH